MKVPEPVSLIVKVLGLRAVANATPPGLIVFGVVEKFWLVMSQRTSSAEPSATGSPKVTEDNRANDTTALARIHLGAIFMLVLLS
jgi:hypothetical protein